MFQNLKKGFVRLQEMGLTEELSIVEAKRVKSTNTLGFFPLLMYLVYFVFGLVNKYYFPVVICSILFVFSVFGLFLNYKRRYILSKNLIFSINTFAVFITYNSLNVDYSICCYFFPLIMAYEILFEYKKAKRFQSFSIYFLITCFLLCFLVPKGVFYYFAMPDDLLQSSKLLNIAIPFILSLIFLYEILDIHNNSEGQLLLAKMNAETASKAKTDFLNNMSHELRTPLNGIIGSTDILLNENMNASQKRYFEIIQYSGEHMLNLVNDILDFSKVQSGKLELDENPFNLNTTIGNISKMFKSLSISKGVEFKVELDPATNIWVESDEMRLTQVLHNLLSNAIKFTEDGSITLVVKVLNSINDKVSIEFKVTDTGIGIKEQDQLKIFESFTQANTGTSRKYGGTGLGLTISRQIVEKFGSELQIESNYGVGSVFSFILGFTIKEQEKIEVLEAIRYTEKYDGKLNVLVAEDNPINMVVVKNLLKRWEINVTSATDGLLAVKAFEEGEFDLVLLDLEMPIMDGYEAAKIIRVNDSNIPIIAFTAATYENMKDVVMKKGFNDYIYKPFKPNDLASIIKKYTSVSKAE